MEYNIALLAGDGIGPEITASAVRVMEKAAENCGAKLIFHPYLIGGAAIDATGAPLPEETVAGCKAADAVLLGAVGGPKWDGLAGNCRPEKALLGIRAALGLYTNLRPAKLWHSLRNASPLRESVLGDGFDLIIVRELTGGIYFGERGTVQTPDGAVAHDTETYSEMEIERIGRAAFRIAEGRSGRVISVDKANVLDTSRLWRATMYRLAEEHPNVQYADMLVDNAAMQLVRNPGQFDVIVTSNLFGDILSDEAAQLTGSIGLLASASLGDGTRGLYEPVHGSAPDIAGKDIANPIATILSGAMLMRHSLGLTEAADAIEHAVDAVLAKGLRTADLIGDSDAAPLSCSAMTEAILHEMDNK